MAYPCLGTETVFSGKAFSVRRDQIRHPSGRTSIVEVVEHPGAIALVPIDQDGSILFVRQYRHPTGRMLLEIPAGTLSHGEEPELCARRECREEIGMSPGRLTHLGGVFLAPGYSTEFIHFYLAEDLRPDPLTPDIDEDLRIERLTWEEVEGLMADKVLPDAKSIAGLTLARLHLRGRSGAKADG